MLSFQGLKWSDISDVLFPECYMEILVNYGTFKNVNTSMFPLILSFKAPQPSNIHTHTNAHTCSLNKGYSPGRG